MTELLTELERDLVARLGTWWVDFGRIVGADPLVRDADLDEAVRFVHGLQRMVLKQAAARAYPTEFRLLGERVDR